MPDAPDRPRRADGDAITFQLFNEIGVIEQLAHGRFARAMPPGLQVSHFTVLNHFARLGGEKTPAQLARALQVTRGAMTNTLQKLEAAGLVRIRADAADRRRKLVSLTERGLETRNVALAAIAPHLEAVTRGVGADKLRSVLPVLREIRILLGGRR